MFVFLQCTTFAYTLLCRSESSYLHNIPTTARQWLWDILCEHIELVSIYCRSCLTDGTALQLSQITKTSSLRPGWRSDESQAAVQPPGCRRQSLLFKHKAHGEERASLEICVSGGEKMDSTLPDNTLAIIRVTASPFELVSSVNTPFPFLPSCLFSFLLLHPEAEIEDLEMAF